MKILLFSTDEYFLNVFTRYLSKEKLEFDLFSYSEEEAAIEFLAKSMPDIILCEEGYLSECAMLDRYVALGMHTVYPSENQIGILNIYQKVSQVKEELEYMIQVLGGKNLTKEQGKATMAAFFSTEGGSGKTTLAYLTAVESAKQKKTLYINLEALAVTEFLYTSNNENSMENILLSFDSQREETASMLLNAMEKTIDGVSVLPTLKNIGDYLELSPTVILQMISAICKTGGIENVILDLPGMFSSFTETLLQECKKIVWVYNDSRIGKRKLEMVQNDPYLKATGILSKSIYVMNRCASQGIASTYHAAFPISKTLSTANQISKILEVNEAFAKGCQNIAKKAELL